MAEKQHRRGIRKGAMPARYQNFQEELFEPAFYPKGDFKARYNGTYKDSQKDDSIDTYHSLTYKELNPLLQAIHGEQLRAMECLYTYYVADNFTPYRGVLVGSGEVSPFNVGFHVQAPHGLPYLPGSGIQGMLRNFMIQTLFGNNETQANQDEGFALIFGKSEGDVNPKQLCRGRVDFLDAYPTSLSANSLKIGVFTNHFGDYYLEKTDEKTKKPILPTDTLFPVPVQFLTLVNTTFRVCAAIRQREHNAPIADGRFKDVPPLTVVAYYLGKAFAHSGVGARTKNNWGRGIFAPTAYNEKDTDLPPTP